MSLEVLVLQVISVAHFSICFVNMMSCTREVTPLEGREEVEVEGREEKQMIRH